MPPYRTVVTLKQQSIKAVRLLVLNMLPKILDKIKNLQTRDVAKIIASFQDSFNIVSDVLIAYVPHNLFNYIADELFHNLSITLEELEYQGPESASNFLRHINIVNSLASIVLNSRLKQLNFTRWPPLMCCGFYKYLVKLTSLEVLDLGLIFEGNRNNPHDKLIIDGLKVMHQLRKLTLNVDGSDLLVQTVCENCPLIEAVDFTSSEAVTDQSVTFLITCQHLRSAVLFATSITVDGMAQLIAESPKLEIIGRCNDYGGVLWSLQQNYPNSGPFKIKRINGDEMSTESLRVVVDKFREVEGVELYYDEVSPDLSVLASLENLTVLKLRSCKFYSSNIPQLFEYCGTQLTVIHLQCVDPLDYNSITDIGRQCPNLEEFMVHQCEMRTQELQYPRLILKSPPFQCLKKLFWSVDSSLAHIEFILIHAVSIESVYWSSTSGVPHSSSMMRIFQYNPLKELQEFHLPSSSDMNMQAVEMFMNCTKLKVLTELDNWRGITPEELEKFKVRIDESNYDLEITHKDEI